MKFILLLSTLIASSVFAQQRTNFFAHDLGIVSCENTECSFNFVDPQLQPRHGSRRSVYDLKVTKINGTFDISEIRSQLKKNEEFIANFNNWNSDFEAKIKKLSRRSQKRLRKTRDELIPLINLKIEVESLLLAAIENGSSYEVLNQKTSSILKSDILNSYKLKTFVRTE